MPNTERYLHPDLEGAQKVNRPIVIVGAPSSIGIRPYDDGTQRRLDLAPAVLRREGIAAVADRDAGDVAPGSYRDFVRPRTGVRNTTEVAAYSHDLAERVATAASDGAFVVLLGGDCSIILGALLGLRQAGHPSPGIAYVDAHTDFNTPDESETGSAASMCLALAVGRGDSPLARLAGDAPLARASDTVILARRDQQDGGGSDAAVLREFDVLDLPHDTVRERGGAEVAQLALARLARADNSGFWIHVDADVIDPSIVPAVDSPEAGGLSLEELSDLLTPLVRHPRALGLEVTIYDPQLDTDGSSGTRLARMLAGVLRHSKTRSSS